MKKISFSLFGLLLCSSLIFAQPVSDNAVIPVSVTLNSILRLNIVSGGNIEFAVNTLTQYTDGVSNNPQYDTQFTVASSTDFNVLLYSEEATLTGSDIAGTSANTMNINNVGYTIDYTGTGGTVGTGANDDYSLVGLAADPSALTELTNTTTNTIVEDISGGTGTSAGDIVKNAFTINWELATSGLIAVTSQSTLLAQGLSSDRYSVNVFLVLDPQ